MPDTTLSYSSPQQTSYEYPRIVAAAKNLFLQQSIGPVTLADIALSLRMPVGAIGRHFPAGKPALVQAVLESHLRYIHQGLEQQRPDSSSAVEELLAMRRLLQQVINDTRALFFHELAAHFPDLWLRLQQVRAEFMLDYLRTNLQRGMQEGFYHAGLDVETLIRAWLRRVDDQQATARTPAELAEAYYDYLTQFLASLTTPVGAYVARRLQEAPPYY